MCAYLKCIAGVILCGLVFKGLAQKECAFVVHLIPVFAIAHVQGGFNMARAFLVSEVDLRRTHKKETTDLSVTVIVTFFKIWKEKVACRQKM